MKNLCFFFLLFSALLQRAQLTKCFPVTKTSTLNPSQVGSRFPEIIVSCLPSDEDVHDYIPNSAMPTLTYNVNFIFLKHPNGASDTSYQNSFYNMTNTQLLNDCQLTVNWIDSMYNICGTTASLLQPKNPGPSVSNPKIKLALNNVYTFTTTLARGMFYNDDSLYNNFPYDTANTVNMYFYTELNTSYAGGGVARYGRFITMGEAAGFSGGYHTPGSPIDQALLWHELGHVLGFLADHYVGDTLVNPITPSLTVYPTNMRPFGYDYDPLAGYYVPSDAALDTMPSYNCSVTTDRPNNNLMGNSTCREVMSARQIAAFHYLVAKGVTKKYTQYNGMSYPYVPGPTSLPTLTLTGTQTLTAISPFSTLIIPSGAKISLQNMNLHVPINAKIIVQQGGRLDMQCVKISMPYQSGNIWRGIEVWGTPGATQKHFNKRP